MGPSEGRLAVTEATETTETRFVEVVEMKIVGEKNLGS
jgi:hypothetical protein